ncbi:MULTISPECIES: prolipoprotein diacylglyceryl transferase [Flavobacterium]|uniref:prolipoprotein diacylglyceryl transferase n=1 Tax=Flavobacterium TaxID=237 RepID=UPI00086A5CE1|nr:MULTISPECIES: prolipoprotein diacylglyceryl transferase [Flavobacterium]MBN9284252.1 prolipoprotein diacylglyceryl transferase [Flavobacterium sp.]ODS79201.1 MAG: prolipoprotein diacylglyceryl transferase [Chryseobacterium sp. SCN 40-13]OJV70669.1 MAG: prolipoprotein diacylglyceryl transferase [Flavobacterium sp. 40-81]
MTHALQFVWNPSHGIDLGFFTVRYYSLMFVVAFGLGWYLMKHIYQREGISIEKLDSLFIYTVFATLIGARLGHVFFYDWDYFKDHKLEILLPFRFEPSFEFTGFAGLASHGAAIAIILVMYYYSKKIIHKPILWILDRIVIPVTCGGIFVRFGNFFNSEIIGHETTSSLGIRFIQDKFSPREAMQLTNINNPAEAYKAIETNPQFAPLLESVIPKHPAQLYEALGYVFVFLILFFLYWKTNAREKLGYLFGIFLVLLWTVRFVVEYVKESQGGFENELGMFSTGQWLSIPFIIIGFILLIRAKKPASAV